MDEHMSMKLLWIWIILASLIVVLSSCGTARTGFTIVHTAGTILPTKVTINGNECEHKVTSVSKELFEARYLCPGVNECIIRYNLTEKGDNRK